MVYDYDKAPTDPHHGGKLTAEMAADEIKRLRERVDELEAIARSEGAMLQELAEAAGYETGDTYSARGIIKALKFQERIECAVAAGKQYGYVSCDENFSRGYGMGREEAEKDVRARETKL